MDSAFPTGGFAHSGGVEAAWQHGHIRDGDGLLAFVRAAMRQCAVGVAPVAVEVVRRPADALEIDAFFDACLSNHVANRASRAQGRALLATAAATFDVPTLAQSVDVLRDGRSAGHLPTAFGLVSSALALSEADVASSYLFMTGRGMLSAAVRLGIVGPLEGQRLQNALAADAETLASEAISRPLEAITQTAPLLDLLQGTQDRLYSRLFQS